MLSSLAYPSSSTSKTCKDVLATATSAGGSAFALETSDLIRLEPNWRWKYNEHAVRHVRVCAEASPEDCLAVARAGLERMYNTFEYGDITLQEALLKRRNRALLDPSGSNYFCTGKVVGIGMKQIDTTTTRMEIVLPVGQITLRGSQVHEQMQSWEAKGVIEPDTAAAVRDLQTADMCLSNSDWVFVIMGAGAAMGPLDTLLSLGATIIALDLPIPALWKKLLEKTKASRGSIIFPMIPNDTDRDTHQNISEQDMVSRAGCNFLTQIPELIDWLTLQYPSKKLVLGSYAYLDSAAFVKVSLAMDAVASECLKVRPDSALAYLCSPTDIFPVPPAARDATVENFRKGGTLAQTIIQNLSGNRVLEQNIVASTRHGKIPLVDALVLQQGPNYFLAKRLQHWRAMIARADNGVVSSNVAPASNTTSVLKNKLLASAYAGAHHFSPIEIFEPETSNVLMTYLLLHDLRQQTEVGETSNRRNDLADHPLNLFATTPVHNGIWRCGFQIRSLLELVVAYYFIEKYQPQMVTAVAVSIGAAAVLRSRL